MTGELYLADIIVTPELYTGLVFMHSIGYIFWQNDIVRIW